MAEKMDLNEKFVLTPDEAAVYIGVGVNQIRSLCSDGQIKATRVGRKWKIPKPCLEQYMLEKAEKGEEIL